MPWCVGCVALAIGLFLYAAFWQDSRSLWYALTHDRSAHYELGLNLAMDVRLGNVAGLRHHLDGARTWGPLHGILVGLAQALFGPDYRFGILPSWLSWMATVVLGFLVTRRLLPQGGTAAGMLAALFIALSPAHRAYATDVMLESLGAVLTLLCLHRYLIAVQDDAPPRGRWLGLSLTLLFFTKTNYWLLVVFGLLAGETLRRPGAAWHVVQSAVRPGAQRAWWIGQLRNPWNCVIAFLLIGSLIVVCTGGTSFHIGTMAVSLTSAHNLIHLAYIVAFVRVLAYWRRAQVASRLRGGPPVVRDLVYWHVWPCALYFLLPKRLGYFLWFITANSDTPREGIGLLRGVPFYLQALQQDYHVFAWLTLGVLAGIVVGFATLSRWRAGAIGIFSFLAAAALLTCGHPMLKNRHAHTWIAVLWVLGSAGMMHLLYVTCRSWPRLRLGLAGGLCLLGATWHGPHWLEPGRAQEGGVKSDQPSILTLSETYLPALTNARRPTLVCNIHSPFFLSWTFQETFHHQRFATAIKGYTSNQPDLVALEAWSKTTRSDALVLIEVAKESPHYADTTDLLDTGRVRRFFQEHDRGLRLAREWHLPEMVHISLWVRARGPDQ